MKLVEYIEKTFERVNLGPSIPSSKPDALVELRAVQTAARRLLNYTQRLIRKWESS